MTKEKVRGQRLINHCCQRAQLFLHLISAALKTRQMLKEQNREKTPLSVDEYQRFVFPVTKMPNGINESLLAMIQVLIHERRREDPTVAVMQVH